MKLSEPENEKRTGERDSVGRAADCKSVVADSVRTDSMYAGHMMNEKLSALC